MIASPAQLKTIVDDTRFGMRVIAGGHHQAESLPATSLEVVKEYFQHLEDDKPFVCHEPVIEEPEEPIAWLIDTSRDENASRWTPQL